MLRVRAPYYESPEELTASSPELEHSKTMTLSLLLAAVTA